MSPIVSKMAPVRVLPFAWIGVLAIALIAQCSYCLVMQSMGGGLNAEAFWLWFAANPAPLAAAAGVASFLRNKALHLLALALVTALLVVASDLTAFPPDAFSPFNVMKRAQDKLPIVVIYIALGASLYTLKQKLPKAPTNPPPALSRLRAAEAIKGAGNYIEALSEGRSTLVRLTLSEAANSLAASGFIRVHRSWIIRLDAIADVRRDREGLVALNLKSGLEVPVGRSYRKAVRETLNARPVIRP